jgi:hypothetical protein
MTGQGITKGIDWLNVVVEREQVPRVIELLNGYLGHKGERAEKGTQHYREAHRWESGALVAWTEGRKDAWVSINGGSLALMTPAQHLQVMKELVEDLGGKCSRVDCRVDVPPELLDLEWVHAAAEGEAFTGFRRYLAMRPRVSGRLEGDQANFGRRGSSGSGKMVRIYNKTLESKGRIRANRIECEFSGERAAMVGQALASSSNLESLGRKVGEYAVGQITFIDRRPDAHGHIDRMGVLAWWRRILDQVGQAEVTVHRAKASLQAGLEWFAANVTKLASTGRQVLEQMGYDGRRIILDLIDGRDADVSSTRIEAAAAVGLDLDAIFAAGRRRRCGFA